MSETTEYERGFKAGYDEALRVTKALENVTPIELNALEAFRAAESVRVIALRAYNSYFRLIKDVGGVEAVIDHSFYERWQAAEQASRVAVRQLSIALGCQPAPHPACCNV